MPEIARGGVLVPILLVSWVSLEVSMRRRRGQSVVEYLLGISVVVIALASGFYVLLNSTTVTFKNANDVIIKPYP